MARGDLPATKRGGRWWLHRRSLPLTEAQRQSLQAKADAVRLAVESALPSRLAMTPGQRSRSLADLGAFHRGAALFAEIRATGPETLPQALLTRITRLLENALLNLAEAVHQFDRDRKLESLHRSRASFAHVAALFLLDAGIPPAEPTHGWVLALETEVIPAVAGFARWAEGLGSRRR
jgi:hypothetical protein